MRIRLLFSDDNRHEREATRQRRGNANACSGPEAAKAAKGRVGLIHVARRHPEMSVKRRGNANFRLAPCKLRKQRKGAWDLYAYA